MNMCFFVFFQKCFWQSTISKIVPNILSIQHTIKTVKILDETFVGLEQDTIHFFVFPFKSQGMFHQLKPVNVKL